MDLTRVKDFYEPKGEIVNIVGCGAIGSFLGVQLAKLGVENFILFDEDKVEKLNITNQAFNDNQVGQYKTEALKELILGINPGACVISVHNNVVAREKHLEGYVFLCPDTVKGRKETIVANKRNREIEGWFDCRLELFAVQIYTANNCQKDLERLIGTLDFTQEEADRSVPRSEHGCRSKLSCGITSSLGALMLAKEFINKIKLNEKYKSIFKRIDLDNSIIESFEL